MKPIVSKAFLFFLSSLCLPLSIYGLGSGGYSNQVPSTRALGRANSVVATVDDASAVTFNPARLTKIKGTNILFGGTVANIRTDYSGSNGQNDSLESDYPITPNFQIASNLSSERWGFGLGINIPHGIVTEWSQSSPLRFIATKSELAIFDINPSVAFKINESVSVGAGLDYYHVSKVELNRQLNVTLVNFSLGGSGAPAPEGSQKLSGDGDDFGFNFGLALETQDRHFFGTSFRKGAKIKVEGDAELFNLSAESASIFGGTNYKTGAKSTVIVPDQFQIGYGHKVNPNFVVEMDAEWNKWSDFNEIKLEFEETNPFRLAVLNNGNPEPKNWRNSWSVGLGGEYIYKENSAFRAGYVFFDSPIPNSSFEASTPDSDIHTLTLGYGYTVGVFSVDLAFAQFFLNERKINNGVGANVLTTGNGTYKTSSRFFGMNFGFKFD